MCVGSSGTLTIRCNPFPLSFQKMVVGIHQQCGYEGECVGVSFHIPSPQDPATPIALSDTAASRRRPASSRRICFLYGTRSFTCRMMAWVQSWIPHFRFGSGERGKEFPRRTCYLHPALSPPPHTHTHSPLSSQSKSISFKVKDWNRLGPAQFLGKLLVDLKDIEVRC